MNVLTVIVWEIVKNISVCGVIGLNISSYMLQTIAFHHSDLFDLIFTLQKVLFHRNICKTRLHFQHGWSKTYAPNWKHEQWRGYGNEPRLQHGPVRAWGAIGPEKTGNRRYTATDYDDHGPESGWSTSKVLVKTSKFLHWLHAFPFQ